MTCKPSKKAILINTATTAAPPSVLDILDCLGILGFWSQTCSDLITTAVMMSNYCFLPLFTRPFGKFTWN